MLGMGRFYQVTVRVVLECGELIVRLQSNHLFWEFIVWVHSWNISLPFSSFQNCPPSRLTKGERWVNLMATICKKTTALQKLKGMSESSSDDEGMFAQLQTSKPGKDGVGRGGVQMYSAPIDYALCVLFDCLWGAGSGTLNWSYPQVMICSQYLQLRAWIPKILGQVKMISRKGSGASKLRRECEFEKSTNWCRIWMKVQFVNHLHLFENHFFFKFTFSFVCFPCMWLHSFCSLGVSLFLLVHNEIWLSSWIVHDKGK